MSIKTSWFSHDANAQDDEDILELRAKFGWEGYGLYWAIIERMRSAPGYKLKRDRMAGLSHGFSHPIASLIGLIEFCCSIGLLSCDDEYFWSDNLLRRMEDADHAKTAAQEAGRRGAQKRWQKAAKTTENQQSTKSDSPAIATPLAPYATANSDPIARIEENRREKKRVEEEERVPARLPGEGFASSATIHVKPALEDVLRYAEVQQIPRDTAESFFDHYAADNWCVVKCDADGNVTSRKPIHDWAAKLRNWHRDNGRKEKPRHGVEQSVYDSKTGWPRETVCPKTGRRMVIDTMKMVVGSNFPYKYADS